MKRIIVAIIVLCVLSIGAMQVYIHFQKHPIRRIVRYVRLGVCNGIADGQDWQNAYPSIQAWADAEAGADLVTSDATHTVYISSPDNVYYQSEKLTLGGWVVDERHYLEVKNDDRL